MSTTLQLRRGTTAQHSGFTGANGEVTVNTTTKTLILHDGTTPGGFPQGAGTVAADLVTHKADTANPHAVTKAQVGLGSVDNVAAAALRDRSTHTGNQPATTMAGDQTFAGYKAIEANLQKVTEVQAAPTISGGVLALDLANGRSLVSLNAAITSITFSNNVASATKVQSHTLTFTADGTARSVVWPSGNGTSTLLVKWPGGVAPTLTSTNGKRDTFQFVSVSEFLWDAFIVGQNL